MTPPTTPPAIGPALEEWCDGLGLVGPGEGLVIVTEDEADGVTSGVSPTVRLSGKKAQKCILAHTQCYRNAGIEAVGLLG